MVQYVIDIDSKKYCSLEDVMEYRVNEIRKSGLNVVISKIKPDNSFGEEKYLIVNLSHKARLITLSKQVDEMKEQISSLNNRGIILYQDIKSGEFSLEGTDILDKLVLMDQGRSKFIRHIFPLPDNNIVASIQEQISRLCNEL